MKMLSIPMVAMLAISAQAADLASETMISPDSSQIPDFKPRLEALYAKEITNVSSPLRQAVDAFAASNELTFEAAKTNDHIGSMSVDIENPILSGGEKGSCCEFAQHYLIPIRAAYDGTGMIESIIGFLRVTEFLRFDQDDGVEVVLSIESILPFDPGF
jgi:hypothetical protein